MKISYSFGIIDLLHYGHLTALKKASENSDYNIFGLVSDEAAIAWQGSIVSSEEERRAVLECIKYIDEVMPQRTFDPTENIKRLHQKYPDAKIKTTLVGSTIGCHAGPDLVAIAYFKENIEV